MKLCLAMQLKCLYHTVPAKQPSVTIAALKLFQIRALAPIHLNLFLNHLTKVERCLVPFINGHLDTSCLEAAWLRKTL